MAVFAVAAGLAATASGFLELWLKLLGFLLEIRLPATLVAALTSVWRNASPAPLKVRFSRGGLDLKKKKHLMLCLVL